MSARHRACPEPPDNEECPACRELRESGLTPREVTVLRMICDGETSAAIALALGISEETVKRHLTNMCDKLGADNRTHLAATAFRRGWVR